MVKMYIGSQVHSTPGFSINELYGTNRTWFVNRYAQSNIHNKDVSLNGLIQTLNMYNILVNGRVGYYIIARAR